MYSLKQEYSGKLILSNVGTGKTYCCQLCDDCIIDGDTLLLKHLSKLFSEYSPCGYTLRTTCDIRNAVQLYTSRRVTNAPGWRELYKQAHIASIFDALSLQKTVLFANPSVELLNVVDYVFIKRDLQALSKALSSALRPNRCLDGINKISAHLRTYSMRIQQVHHTEIAANKFLADYLLEEVC